MSKTFCLRSAASSGRRLRYLLDAYYLGPPDSPRRRICIRVAKMAQANEIVRNRQVALFFWTCYTRTSW